MQKPAFSKIKTDQVIVLIENENKNSGALHNYNAPECDTVSKTLGPKPNCFDKDLVYAIVCGHCVQKYVGETKQFVSKGFKQHRMNLLYPNMNGGGQPNSAAALHHAEAHPGLVPKFYVAKLASGGGYVYRKCLEAVLIQKIDPELNRRIEGSGAMDLYF